MIFIRNKNTICGLYNWYYDKTNDYPSNKELIILKNRIKVIEQK